MSMATPGLAVRSPNGAGPVRGIVLVLNGGRARSTAPAYRRHLAYLRMIRFAAVIHAAVADHGVAVWQLCYRMRGWNGEQRAPVADARWALERARATHPGAPVFLVGHSMGGRTAAYLLGDPDVAGACLLAAWIEPRDEMPAVAGRLVVVAHGDRDRTTNPAGSARFAVAATVAGATVAQFVVPGEGHAMLRRAAAWHALARDACCVAFDVAPPARPGQLARVLAAPAAQRLSVPLAPP